MRKLISIAAFSITLLLIIYSFSLAGPVPDTGQTKCYDNSGEIPCPQPGEPFHGQDAQYNINPQSYTKLNANGNENFYEIRRKIKLSTIDQKSQLFDIL